jgi:UPF0755 protein
MKVMRALRFFMVVVILAGLTAWWVGWAPFGPSVETFVDIVPGTGTAGIAAELKQAGILRSAAAFEAMKEWKGGSLKAGYYRFDHAVPLGEVYGRLRRGDVYTRTVVIPEGYNVFEIAAAIQAAGLGPADAFLKAERADTPLVAAWSPHAQSLEGFLFPDTYRFSPKATPLQMLSAMVKRFGQQWEKLGAGGTEVERTVTMASLVEREVHLDAERATVAGVFENRLAAGMPLQTDPSVVYGSMLRGTWTGVIHQSELHSDSAYNTYAHTGLPPGPICTPGMAALTAALHPTASSYLYFVSDAKGATRFATTLEEHNANVGAYRAAAGLGAPVGPGPAPEAMRPQVPAAVEAAPVGRKVRRKRADLGKRR